jgi:hypothetical protein
VDDADAGQAGEEGAVEEAGDLVLGLVGGAADDVDLGRQVVGIVGGLDGDAATTAGGFERCGDLHRLDLGNVCARHAHLHSSDGDLKVLGLAAFEVEQPLDARLTAEALELDQVADLDAARDVGLGGGVAPVGTGGVGDDR